MMIPAGSGNTERHIAMIEDYGTTVLVATPSYACLLYTSPILTSYGKTIPLAMFWCVFLVWTGP